MTKCRVLFVVFLIALALSGTSAAISTDGVKSIGEWDENWSFGQVNGTGYDSNGPFGDKMVVFQGGSWYDEDPAVDAGETFTDNLSTVGPYLSGYDLKAIYARYDPVTDTLYGMATVYGLPGDLDGDGDPGFDPEQSDSLGANTTNGVNGIGPEEFFNIRLVQGTKNARISVQNNDWNVVDVGSTATNLTDADVTAANSFVGGPECTNCVYEIEIRNLRDSFNLTTEELMTVRVTSGAQDDQGPGGGLVGEDIAEIFITVPNPVINIEKATNGEDADNPTGPELNHGDDVTWTYEVTNEGDVPLENVVVTDDQGVIPVFQSGDTNDDDILDLNETWIYEVEATVDFDFCGQYANIADVVGFYGQIPVTDEDPSHYIVRCAPVIDIEKHTNGFDADFPQGPQIEVGETITWEYFVTNRGDVSLMNIVLVDDQIGIIPNSSIVSKSMNNDDILDVGETWTYVVTDTLEECTPLYKNIATVTGEDETGNVVTDDDPSHYHCQPVVPILTPVGILALISALGFMGIVTIRRRN